MVNIPVVLVPRIMYGVEVRVYAIVLSNIVVVALDIVREVVYHVEESLRVVIVQHIIVGMVVHVPMSIVMCVRVGIVRLVQVW